ncbi:recombination factor protein [Helicobacter canis]|uniref:Replication-associated recombination protein A n=1 Tax=Helicobacter canis TaxID=29419 RepID=A0A377J370_9HELI|nr:recombination factor protein [Helicobacter canis]
MTHLATLLRPQTLDDFLGQSHLLHKNAPLYRAIAAKQMPHCFFYGPPGTGKTTLARLIAKNLGDVFLPFNATKFKLESLHSALKPYQQSLITPLVFIDEVHRLTKPQQEALLPIMEDRVAIVLGASTENPFYTLTNAIRSRSLLCEFKPLNVQELEELLKRALEKLGIQKVDSSVAGDSNGDLALLGGDLALGEHSADLANFGTAIPKILEEEKRAKCEKTTPSSLRADLSAWQSTQTKTQNLESTFENSAADTQKVDSRENAQSLNTLQNEKTEAVFDKTPQAEAVEMRKQAKRCKAKPQQVSLVNRGFLKKHRLTPSGIPCFQGVGEGIYLGDNEQAHAVESTIYRSKPAIAVQGEAAAGFFRNATPESDKTESTSKKPSPHTKKTITQEACSYLISSSGGDGRAMLNLLEVLALSDHITLEDVKSLRPVSLNDGTSEASTHYNLASALIKSIRGSDTNASIYYLARLIAGGENPEFIARRLVILASEDIGNANPNALNLATSTMLSVSKIGYPEARIILAQCVIYLASCPKSNTAYTAINSALEAINQGEILPISPHILPHSKTYKYPHNFGGYVEQQYLLKPLKFVNPTQKGFEKTLNEWLAKIHQTK